MRASLSEHRTFYYYGFYVFANAFLWNGVELGSMAFSKNGMVF